MSDRDRPVILPNGVEQLYAGTNHSMRPATFDDVLAVLAADPDTLIVEKVNGKWANIDAGTKAYVDYTGRDERTARWGVERTLDALLAQQQEEK